MDRLTTKHFWALDTAVNSGVEVECNGKTWTFSALTFKDEGLVMAAARKDALASYFDVAKESGIQHQQRQWDMNSILFGAAPQAALVDPQSWYLKVKLSLKKKHPKVTDAEVEAFFEDDELAQKIIDVVEVMSVGPLEGQPGDEAASGANPTKSADPLPTTSASAT